MQPNSGYGPDNRCLLETIARSDGCLKGVAVVANEVSRDELAALKAGGIVGIAFNVALFGAAAYENLDRPLDLLAELDLIAQFQVQNEQLLELMPMLGSCGTRLLFDHCGRPNIGRGLEGEGFRALLGLGRAGNAWVKLSGCAKFSGLSFPYADAWAYIHALADAFTLDRCVWGSDWPFLRGQERIDYGTLLKLVEQLFPTDADRRKLMWETPRALFGCSGHGSARKLINT